jgi:alcohol dehydrogenase (cytochrome c)
MKWLRWIAVAVALLVYVGDARAGAQSGVGVDAARQYAVTCAGCHAADGSGSAKGPAIGKLAATAAKSDAELMRIVREGVPGKGMPSMKVLGDERIAALVLYLRVLQTANGATIQTQIAEPPNTMQVAPKETSQAAVVANDRPGAGGAAGAVNVTQTELNQKQAGVNWVSYNGDYSGRRNSGLAEVTVENAASLKVKWRFHTPATGVMEGTPVVVDGVMFFTRSNDVWALDAATGKMLWHHTRAVTDGLVDDASGHINRGVAVLGTRVYAETDNAHLVCLDAQTGKQIWDVQYATGNRNYGATSAPLIVKDKVLVSASGGDDGVRGFLAALDAQTGKEMWRFWSIPAPGEKGSESWPGDMYLHGGGTMWMPGTYDAELNILYWGTGNPAPDFNGSGRPGDDLYTSSVVALDPETGRLKWHFQYSPHNLFDYDANQTQVLVDTVFAGKPRKLIVTANRNGFIYILDRTTGEYLASKQFIPMLNWAKGIDAHGRPISNNLVPDAAGVTVCPSVDGGSNWYSPSYDPDTNTFYFRSLETCSVVRAQEDHFAEGEEYYGGESLRPPDSAGDYAKESSWLNAFDLSTMDFAWRNRLTADGFTWAGVMSTAGGLVAFGNDKHEFEVDEAKSGRKLWAAELPAGMHASPMAYAAGGRQFFAVAAGDDVIAFGLK